MTRSAECETGVESRTFTFDGVRLESGRSLGPVTVAYETYGTLSPAADNAVLVVHGFSGDAHAAGLYPGDKTPGWWDGMIGPGRALDTDRYFVICSNVLGGCRGSTGPSSVDPRTGAPYGLEFPPVSIGDMVACQKRLVEHLGIHRLLSVIGGSMGGMQVLAWMTGHPESLASAIPIATAMRHSPQQIAFNEVGRRAIIMDPHWLDGGYYGGPAPAKGLAVARMVGHITYMSEGSMTRKFGRRRKADRPDAEFDPDFEVEGYLRYRGDTFVKRFDANSYLYITKAMDNFDAAADRPVHEALKGARMKVLVIAFTSDWLYPAHQSREIVKACKLAGVPTTYCEIESTYGHDSFLVDLREQTHLVTHFLASVERAEKEGRHGA